MKLAHRGVWIAPFRGPNNEMFVYCIDSRDVLVAGPIMIPHGADYIAATDRLWDQLDAAEPENRGLMGAPPRWTLVRRSRRFRLLSLLGLVADMGVEIH